MRRTNAAVAEEVERPAEEMAPAPHKPRPFSLRYAEEIGPRPVRNPSGPGVFDDPTTVEHTDGNGEDAYTDES